MDNPEYTKLRSFYKFLQRIDNSLKQEWKAGVE